MRTLLVLLLGTLSVAAQFDLRDPAFLARLVPQPSAASYFFEETFEGSGYSTAGWTELGGTVIDEDYATSPAPLVGSQSLYMFHAFNQLTVTNHVGAMPVVYGKFVFNLSQPGGAVTFFALQDVSATTPEFRLRWDDNGGADTLTLFVGSISATGASGLTAGTTYYVWFWFDQSANDGSVWISTTNTKPGSAEATITNGDTGAVPEYVQFGTNANGSKVIIDGIQLSTADFQ